MRKHKLIELLQGLTRDEFRRFGDFVRSPYFNKNQRLVYLYEYYQRFFPFLNDEKFTKEDIYFSIYKSKPTFISKVDILSSELAGLLENFLIIEESRKDKIACLNILIKTLRTRNCTKSLSSNLRTANNMQRNESNHNLEYYYNQLALEWENWNSKMEKIIFKYDNSFQKVADSIDLLFVSTKLDNFIIMYHHLKELSPDIKYKMRFKRETLNFVEHHLDLIKKEHPLIYCNYLILILLLKSDNFSNYNKLKKYINLNSDKFDDEELYHIYTEMKNYLAEKGAPEDMKILKEIFNIYTALDEKSLFQKQQYILHVDFIDTVVVGLALGKLQWVEYFYGKYENNLSPDFKCDTLNLVNAQIYFYKREYYKALEVLKQIKYKNLYFYFRINVNLIKIYFEINDIEGLLNVIDSFSHYLKRNKKILERYYEMMMNFLHYVRKLNKIDQSSAKTGLKALKKNLATENNIAAKAWLMEKTKKMLE